MNSAATTLKAPILKFDAPKPINSWQYEDLYGDSGDNRLNGGDGPNYIYAGAGNDYLFSGNNDSTWRGSGNEFMAGASYLDGGSGDDIIQVWADKGAFEIDTGTGKDHVLISNDADYVRINNYADGPGDPGDTFEFGMAFSGNAAICSRPSEGTRASHRPPASRRRSCFVGCARPPGRPQQSVTRPCTARSPWPHLGRSGFPSWG